MKRFVYLALAAIMICSLSLPAFAVGESGVEITEDYLTEDFFVENEALDTEVISPVPDDFGDGAEITEDDLTEDFLAENELVGIELMSLAPITSEDTEGFKSVLLEFIGDYDPVIVEYEYQNSNTQYSSYLREVQPDYVWLVAAGMVTVFIYCLFRLGGALFCRNK